MWAFSFSFFLEELLLHPSREEFSSLLVKNNRAEILVCQDSKEKRRVRKIKATLGGWLTSRHTGIKHCDSIECDTKCMFKEKKECMCRFTYAQVNEVLLFEHVAVFALFELNECGYVCRDGRIARSHVHMLEPPSLVSLSVSFLLVQWAHVWRTALSFFLPHFSSLFASEKS